MAIWTTTIGATQVRPVNGPLIILRPPPANDPGTVSTHTVPAWSPPTTSLDIVREIADVMQVPPAQITVDYINRCIHAAGYLQNPVPSLLIYTVPQSTRDVTPVVGVRFRTVNQPKQTEPDTVGRTNAQQGRAHVLAVIDQVASFSRQAQGAGFAPPSNPYTEIARLNALRGNRFTPLTVTQKQADDILYNIQAYVDIIQAWKAGAIDLRSGTMNKAQIAHIRLSFDGFGGSGNPAADLQRFLPSLDDIKKARADAALSVVDFTKRTPYVLFTLDYVPEQGKPSKGTIIAWKKIPDASGYVLKRRDVFAQADRQLTITNQQVNDSSAALMVYARQYALSLLGTIDESTVMLWLDSDVPQHDAFVYKIQAYQVRAEMNGSVFTVDSIPSSITAAVQLNIQNQLAALNGQDQDLVSPWPTVAQQLMGDSQYDWMLAAVNVRASINRGDPKETTRKYSYLNAQHDFIFTQAQQNRLVQPTKQGIQQIANNIASAIEKYGVNQVIQDLLDETGITYFFDGRDPRGTSSFTRAGRQSTATSPLFNVIGSAIDPDTATLDLKSLASNLPQLLDASSNAYSDGVLTAVSNVGNHPKEIAVEDPTQAAAVTEQFVDNLGDLKDAVIDLTTFDGLAKLMRTIRVFSDFGPDRVKPTPTTGTP